MSLHHLMLVLWARRIVVLYSFLGTVLVAAVLSLISPKEFTATSAVVLDVKSPDPIAGMVLPGLVAPGYMATQIDIISSDQVTRHVIKILHLDEDPVIRRRWEDVTGGKGRIEAWLIPVLQKKLDVKPSRESNVISINYSGASPELAASLANAYAQAYIDVNLELLVAPARQNSKWFDEQTKQYRDRLDTAQRALADYQQETGIIGTDEHTDNETHILNELSTQLVMARTQSADAVSRRRGGAADEGIPEVVQNLLITQLKTDIARLEAKLDADAGNLGDNHPQFQRSQAELAALGSRLNAEVGRITSAVGAAGSVSKQKVAALDAAVAAQKAKILDIKKQRSEIALLMREVENAQRAYEAVGQRTTQSRLESQSIQTNVSLLDPASEPIKAATPKVALNILLAGFVGSLLGIGAALGVELLNRCIRSAQDMSLALDLPVLAVLEPDAPRPGTWLSRKIALLPLQRPRIAYGRLS